ncbi:putative cyclin-dependent kinase F-2 [Setaria italica]|uniref:putative cyclin-dependent kinase F-2 n=1 Tax=Setaria italica TaxID=4555 RepID=UPI000BE57C77|nr:putative cyclin-dependent kinase F-2 [Setaria italica]
MAPAKFVVPAVGTLPAYRVDGQLLGDPIPARTGVSNQFDPISGLVEEEVVVAAPVSPRGRPVVVPALAAAPGGVVVAEAPRWRWRSGDLWFNVVILAFILVVFCALLAAYILLDHPGVDGLVDAAHVLGFSADSMIDSSLIRLGEGAFGAVVKARHRATGRIVAIKRVGKAHGGHAALLREARFLEETSGGGANPFVVGFHGVVRRPDAFDLSLVMECVGPSLHNLLRQRPRGSPPLPESMVRAAMWQLLTGAKKMHGGHIVHRDIKPANILVGDDHRIVKLCDFGLAMSTDERPPYKPAGTLWYMAPEMLLEKPDYDERVDIWSLGCVMAELINNGSPLFQGFYGEGQLCAIFDVLGTPDDSTWPWFSSTAFATVVMPELDMQRENNLRELIPESKLSKEGFDVLSGLLTCNPEKRLTAAAALKHPWFDKIDVLELPKKEEFASPMSLQTKRRRMHAV